jgi:hypothetical protein
VNAGPHPLDDQAELIRWLADEANPPVRYLVARDLESPPASGARLHRLRAEVLEWPPLVEILDRQRADGMFGAAGKRADARATLWALCLLQRCGCTVDDEPVGRAVEALERDHVHDGALTYLTGGSGVLPCYLGVGVVALLGLGATTSPLVWSSVEWLVEHQRFDHRDLRSGGDTAWPFAAPHTYGCWETVSCYHGVAAAFRALAAIPDPLRTPAVRQRLDEAVEYLRRHRLYRATRSGRPLFRHLTQSFLVGDYRSDLLDLLQGVADADPTLVRESWVADAVEDMRALTVDGRVVLAKNYGRRLIDPIPLEEVGAPSRFLTYQWLRVQSALGVG